MVKFLTKEFFEKVAEIVNKDPKFKTILADFEGSFIMRCPEKGIHTYFEIRNGELVNIKEVRANEWADFILEAPWNIWMKIGTGELMVRDAIMSGELKLTGDLMTLTTYSEGFGVMLRTMAELPKEF